MRSSDLFDLRDRGRLGPISLRGMQQRSTGVIDTMAARAIWKGRLKLGSASLPVNLYSAVIDRNVRFHILEKRTESRVKQHMVDPNTGKEVPSEEIQKGYQVEPGRFVILSDEELEKLEPEPSRDIEITRFVSPSRIGSQWYERPYYLGPNGDVKDYFALARALADKDKEGVARWVMRGKEYTGALRAQDGYLMLVTMRHPEEVVSAEDLPSPAGRALEKNELKMAAHLVDLLEGKFDPAQFQDEYRERVLEFIESKARGKAPKLHRARSKRTTTALDAALSKSIAALKKQKEKAAA
jgi:DNA end-binding protein Ku